MQAIKLIPSTTPQLKILPPAKRVRIYPISRGNNPLAKPKNEDVPMHKWVMPEQPKRYLKCSGHDFL
jgi:hypothetical protein